ncbi:MAG: histidine kinase [Neisseria sp.]|nr:histidine kinase [Neisseria sp.]
MLFIALTVLMTWRLEDRGVAINEAGRLNSQIYRLAALSDQKGDSGSQLASIRHTLVSLARHDSAFCCSDGDTASSSIGRIRAAADRFAADVEKQAAGIPATPPLLQQADSLHKLIENYAQALEYENTRSIGLLRWVRMALAALILGSAAACFVMLRKTVLQPLAMLHGAIERITHGNLNTRLALKSRDEFEVVSDGFNQMSANLQDMYTHLEDKVARKTAELSRQNHEWETLYQITSFLHTHDFSEQVQEAFLTRILTLVGLKAGGLFWCTENCFYAGARHGLDENQNRALLEQLVNYQENQSDEVDYIYLAQPDGTDCRMMLIPVRSLGGLRGVMVLQTNGHEPAPADERLLGLLCTQLGIAQENADLIELKRQHAVLEERNMIAQGLHDSLAQSLSFLNIRFQMLRKNQQLQQDGSLQNNLALIQDGIEYCYEDVRELLNNFRTRPVQGDFTEAVSTVVSRYRKQMGIDVDFYLLSDKLHLSAEQQIQILFILQEALSNIRKHALARHVDVVLDDGDDFCMTITDDGCGFDTDKNVQSGHIGLSVMRERAEKIEAEINIDSQLGQGTRISLKLAADKR